MKYFNDFSTRQKRDPENRALPTSGYITPSDRASILIYESDTLDWLIQMIIYTESSSFSQQQTEFSQKTNRTAMVQET